MVIDVFVDVIIQRVQIKKKSRTRMETRRTLPFQVKVEKKAGKIVQDVGRESGEMVQWKSARQEFQKEG